MDLFPRLIAATLLLGLAPPAVAEELARSDRELLDELLRTTLFDPPRDAERVVVKASVRDAWGKSNEVDQEAWLVPASDGRPARLVLADGRTMKAPSEEASLRRVDLVAT